MGKIVKIGFIAIAVFSLASMVSAQRSMELTAVRLVNLDLYAGRWYEIAKYPNKFQKQCYGNTTATYTVKKNQKLEVLNECLKQDGTTDTAKADGKIADKKSFAKLKVRFAPECLSFLPFVWANYWIIDLDPNYEYAVVGEPSRKYLWILSRTPEMNDAVYQDILWRIQKKGYVPNRLVKTLQNITTVKGAAVEKN